MGENSKISWTLIPGFETYAVDRTGTVYSCVKPGRWGGKTAWHPLKSSFDKHGYARVNLGRGNMRRVHELVLLTFIGPCPPKMEGRHRDGDTRNNRLSNLRWGTPRQNMRDQYRHGTRVAGERHPQHKLKTAQVVELCALWDTGEHRQRALAKRFGITQGAVSMIVNKKLRVTDG